MESVSNKRHHKRRCLAFWFWQGVIVFALFSINSALTWNSNTNFIFPSSVTSRMVTLHLQGVDSIRMLWLPFKRSAAASPLCCGKQNRAKSGHWDARRISVSYACMVCFTEEQRNLSSTMHTLCSSSASGVMSCRYLPSGLYPVSCNSSCLLAYRWLIFILTPMSPCFHFLTSSLIL